jgi:tetratricopeptide (TPR) repeat protein
LQNNSKVSVVFVFSILLLCACGSGDPSQADLVPANLSRLDPNVIALVEQQMTRIKSQPRAGASYAELGMIYEANILWPDARRAYAVAVDLEPTSTWWRFHLAVATRTAGETEEALRLLRDLTAEHPELAPAQQRLGEALTEVGELTEAAAAYQRVTDLLPGSPEGYHGLGEVRLLQRDYAAARELLERAVALDPRYRGSRYALGLAYRGLGLLEKAQRELALGVDASPRYLTDPLAKQIRDYAVNRPARRNTAAAMLHGGRPEQAALLLEQVLNEQPGNATDLNNLAIAYMRMERFDEARATLEEARQIAPEKFSTWLNLSSLAMRNGDPGAAVMFAEGAVERAPTMAQTHVALAMAEAELGNLERTAAALQRALQLDARDPQTHGMLAEVCVQLGRLELAERHFQSVLALVPDSLTGILGLGRLYLQQGRLDRAGAMLARASELAPGNARVAAFEREILQRTPSGERK